METREQVTAVDNFPRREFYGDTERQRACWAKLRDACADLAAQRGLVLDGDGFASRAMVNRKVVPGPDCEPRAVECVATEAEFVTLRLAVWAVP